MTRKARRRYEILALLAVLWWGSVAFQDIGNPRAENVELHRTPHGYRVECEVRNPGRNQQQVAAVVMLFDPGASEEGIPLVASPKSVLYRTIPAKSSIRIEHPLKVPGSWPQAGVLVYINQDPPMLEAAWRNWLNRPIL